MAFAASPEAILTAEVARREETDYRFAWGTYIGWTILSFGFYASYATYRLVARREEHGKRRVAYAAALWHSLATRADTAGRRAEAQPGLDNISRIHTELATYERTHHRNPTLWFALRVLMGFGGGGFRFIYQGSNHVSETAAVVFGVIFLVLFSISGSIGAYINHFLNRDLWFIERWEDSLAQNAAWTMRAIGVDAREQVRTAKIPERNTALYVLGTIFTGGLFAIRWRYVTMRDGNLHFDHDALHEDATLRSLGLSLSTIGPPLPPGST